MNSISRILILVILVILVLICQNHLLSQDNEVKPKLYLLINGQSHPQGDPIPDKADIGILVTPSQVKNNFPFQISYLNWMAQVRIGAPTIVARCNVEGKEVENGTFFPIESLPVSLNDSYKPSSIKIQHLYYADESGKKHVYRLSERSRTFVLNWE